MAVSAVFFDLLPLHNLCKKAVSCHELVIGPRFYDPALIQCEDPVAGTDRGQAVRDDDPNTRFEGWLHYEDNIRRQIVTSLEDWIKSGKKEPFEG